MRWQSRSVSSTAAFQGIDARRRCLHHNRPWQDPQKPDAPVVSPHVTVQSETAHDDGRDVEHLAKNLISWASILEPGAADQVRRTAAMPFIWPHLAIMPDAHQGKGCTVGSVIPTLGRIVQAARRRLDKFFWDRTELPVNSGAADLTRAVWNVTTLA
jgi:tRNA-splicing ligase RtcB